MKDILKKIENKEYLNLLEVQTIRDNIFRVAKYFKAEDVTILDFGNRGCKVDINDNIYFNLGTKELKEIEVEVLY